MSLGRLLPPAGGDVAEDRQRAAFVGEVTGVEHGQRAVDVALHGVRGVVAVRSHREGPVVHQPWDHVRGEGDDHGLQRERRSQSQSASYQSSALTATHVCCHGQDGHALQDGLPRPDVLGLLRHHAAELGGDLPGVHPYLKQVVDQSQDGSQREGGHEQGDEAKLDDWRRKKETIVRPLIISVCSLTFLGC